MMKKFALTLFFLIPLTCFSLPTWSPEEQLLVKSISDSCLSPNHELLLYTVTQPSATNQNRTYSSSIYLQSTDKTRASKLLESPETNCFHPKWSPNGRQIAYLVQGKDKTLLTLFDLNTNQKRQFTYFPSSVQTFAWSPDSSKIAFVMTQPSSQNETINRLWLLDLKFPDLPPASLTNDLYCVRGNGDSGNRNVEFDWSPDGKKITFSYSPSSSAEDYYLSSHLATIDLATGLISPWKIEVPHESMPRYSPDGSIIAFLASEADTSYTFEKSVHLFSLQTQQRSQLAHTFNGGPLFTGPSLLGWNHEGNGVYLYEPYKTNYQIYFIPMDGSPAKMVISLGSSLLIKEPSLSLNRTAISFTGSHFNLPPEAYWTELVSYHPNQISQVNQRFLDFPKVTTKIVNWRSKDGLEIEGLLTYPVNYKEGNQYPLLLILHGGPMMAFEESYIGAPGAYPLASFAQKDKFILRPNPRGSTGYGKAFRQLLLKDWGGKETDDLLTGVDFLIAEGKIDKDQLGVMGWSYGGYLASWLISQTTCFKGASIGGAPVNLVSMGGTSDLAKLVSSYLGEVWENPKLYHERSPLYYVPKIMTPCLIQHGEQDQRVPVLQAFEMARALKKCNKKVYLSLYPGMGHHFHDPLFTLQLMKTNLTFFQSYDHNNL